MFPGVASKRSRKPRGIVVKLEKRTLVFWNVKERVNVKLERDIEGSLKSRKIIKLTKKNNMIRVFSESGGYFLGLFRLAFFQYKF